MNYLMKSFVTSVFIAVLQHRDVDAQSCYWCASKNLQYQWQVTGLQLPTSVSTASNFFVEYCDNNPNASLKIDTSCADFCFAMMITLLNVDGSATAGQNYWIRGCHKDFTNYQYPSSGTSLPTQGKCEYGSITRYTNSSQGVLTPACYGWCKIDVNGATEGSKVPCNGQTSITQFSGSNPTCQVTQTKINCMDCVDGSTNKPCTGSSTSTAVYCYKSDLYVNYQHFITRSISDINPLFPGASGDANNQASQPQLAAGRCGKVSVTNIVPARAYASYSGYDCYCNTNDKCNGAVEITAAGLFTSIMTIIGCMLAK